MPDFVLKAHDRLPSIQAALSTAGEPVDLSSVGTTVNFVMRTAQGSTVKVNAAATVVAASEGVVQYDWQANDTDVPGSYVAEWQVIWPGGKRQTFPTMTFHSVEILQDLDNA